MGHINSRRKGAKAERVAAKMLQDWTGRTFSKTPASGGLQWKKSNVAGDVVCTKEGHYFPFCVEVKARAKVDFNQLMQMNLKHTDILEFWTQAKRDAARVNKVPIVMMRYNGLPKEFYFIILGNSFVKELLLKWPEPYMHFVSETNNLWIFRSTEFFKLPYKELREIAKCYGKKKKG